MLASEYQFNQKLSCSCHLVMIGVEFMPMNSGRIISVFPIIVFARLSSQKVFEYPL